MLDLYIGHYYTLYTIVCSIINVANCVVSYMTLSIKLSQCHGRYGDEQTLYEQEVVDKAARGGETVLKHLETR